MLRRLCVAVCLLVVGSACANAQSVTTTALAVSSGGTAVTSVVAGSVVKLTATVLSGSAGVSPGQVMFCDAAVTYCTDIHRLGILQLSAAGIATLTLHPTAGNHSYKAIFLGTNTQAKSSSSAATLAITAASGTSASTTAVTGSGTPGNYTLTATVSGSGTVAPGGTVSFLDTSNANYILGTASLGVGGSGLNLALTSPIGANAPGQVLVGDFNGDGNVDYAVLIQEATESASTVSVLLGDGAGSISSASLNSTPGAAGTSTRMVAGDFNGDGNLDLAVLDGLDDQVTLLLGKGDGTFTPSSVSLPTGRHPAQIATGDFNGDGIPDLVVVDVLSTAVTILFGNGDGTFALSPMTVTTQGTQSSGIVVGDFNGDGKADLAILNFNGASVTILLGDGHGQFTQASTPATGSNPLGIVMADFNGDGKQDLAIVNEGSNNITVLMGSGDGNFTAATVSTTTGQPSAIAFGDFNGDGIVDLAIANFDAAPASTLPIFLGKGDGTFISFAVPAPVVNEPNYVAVGDFNNDGLSDVVLSGSVFGEPAGANGSIFISLMQATGSATASVSGISVVGTGTHYADASYSGNANLAASVSGTTPLTAEPVVTALQLNATPVSGAVGQMVTLAATLSPDTAQDHQAGGTVTFYDGGVAIGTAVNVSGGIATLSTSTLPMGSDSLTAVYSGDTNFATSTSSALTFQVANTGAPLVLIEPVGTTSPVMTATMVLASAGTIGGISVSTQGVVGLDFNIVSGGTCVLIGTYMVGQTCTVNFVFKPTVPGTRYGGIVLSTSTGAVLSTQYLQGTGTGPQVNFIPGQLKTLPFTLPGSVTSIDTDAAGNFYLGVFDPGGTDGFAVLKETKTATGYVQSTIKSGIGDTVDVAVDGVGNVWIADAPHSRVFKEAPNDTGYIESLPLGNVAISTGMAVDGSGNVFIASPAYGIMKQVYANGSYTLTYIDGDVTKDYQQLIIDGKGILTSAAGYLFTPQGNGGYIRSTFPGGYGVGEDLNGNLYVGQQFGTALYKDTLSNGTYTQNVLGTFPSGITCVYTDSSGNVFFGTGTSVMELDYSDPPSLSFANTAMGATSSDSPKTVTIMNAGNAPLHFAPLGGGNDPLISPGFTVDASSTCPILSGSVSAVSLAVEATCGYGVNFSPVAPGVDSGKMIVFDDSLNAVGTTQIVPLNGIANGMALVPTLTGISPNSGPVNGGTAVTITGTNFSGATAVNFGGVAAVSFVVDSPTSIVAVSPAGTGTVDVTVTTAGGTTPVNAADAFTYIGVPNGTSLAITAGGVPVTLVNAGTVVTLTTTVGAGNLPVTTGQVRFCDASAPSCSDIHLLGVAQLTSAGAAVLRLTPAPGAHKYIAIFDGNASVAVSASPIEMLAVGNAARGSNTYVLATGTVGNYTLTATVAGEGSNLTPTGQVSFLDTTNANYVLGTGTLSTTNAFHFATSAQAAADGTSDVKVVDLDGDGKLDIVAANHLSGSISVLLGNGDGTFHAAPSLQLAPSYLQLAIADFNGDGIPDIAVSATNSIEIFLGNGDGTFAAPSSVSTSSTLGGYALATGDFNGDGIADLAVNSNGNSSVQIFFGNGDGTFRAQQVTAAPISVVNYIVAGDFNGDGITDLAAVGSNCNGVVIMLGKSDGTFQVLPVQLLGSTTATLLQIVAGDFDGDGKLDLAVGTDILHGIGDGTFSVLPNTTGPGIGIEAGAMVTTGDFNGDDILDFAVMYPGSSTDIELYLGNGDGTFHEMYVPGTPVSAIGEFVAATGDFNGDGLSDIAAGSYPDPTLNVFLAENSVTTAITGVSIVGTGMHYIDAVYAGDSVFPTSTSRTVPLTAEPVSTTAVLAASATTVSAGVPVTFTATIAPDTAQSHDAGGTVSFYSNGTLLGSAAAVSGGVASLTTVLPSGTTAQADKITCVYSGDINFATSSCVAMNVMVNAIVPSTTTLVSSLNPSSPGQSVTFTATVSSTVSGQGTPSGSIVFSYGSTVLGTVALGATGSASVSTSTLPLGSDTITATYQPLTTFGTSSNTLVEMVELPQTILFSQLLPPAYMGTSVVLRANASSGLPVSYSVVSGPATVSGSVLTYIGVGNVVVEADQVGDATYAAAPAMQQTVMTTLLSEPVGTSSGTVATVVTFSSAGTLGSIAGLTLGAPGLDFAAQLANPRAVGDACVIGMTYVVGQTCTLTFTFDPPRPGQRYGGIVLSANSGAMLANSYVYGVGVGPQIGWLPGTQTLLGPGGLNSPSGVAVDGSGNVFVSEYGGGLAEITSGGAQRTLGSFGLTSDVAVDGSGNVFVTDTSSVYEVMAVNGAVPASPTIVTLATGFSQLNGIALDGTGNVFLANGVGTDGEVYELAAVNGVIPSPVVPRTLGSGFQFVTGVAVDANGNVFASDEGNQGVYEIEAVNGVIGASPVIRALGGTFQSPSNVGLDAANDVYVTDYISGIVSEFMAVNGSVPANPVIRTVGTGIIEPQGMVVDGNGNIFIADEAVAQVVKLDYADPPSLTFATTAVGSVSSDSPQTVTISNDGNAPLVFTIPTSGTNASITSGFTIGSGSTCPQSTNATTTAPQLATGASCTEAISFAPVVIGVDNGKMVVTDDAVDLAQTVLLNGIGTTPTTTVLQSSLNPAGVGVSVTFTATVTSPAGTPTGSVTFTDGTTTLGSGTLTGGIATYSTSSLTMGTHTITATYTGASDFEQSTASLMQTIGYQSVTTTSVSPEPSLYGQPTVFSVHVAGAPGSIGTPSGMVQFVYCHGATYNVTLDANGNGSYVAPVAGGISEPVGSCPYTAHYQGDAYFFPSVSTTTPYDVNPAASTTTVSAAPNPGYLGQAVTLTAQVAGVGSPTLGPGGVTLQPGSLVATGTVQFYDGTTPIGSVFTLNGAQTASLVTSALTIGPHTITAKYSGDTNLSGSTSVGVIEVIQQVATTTTLIVAPNPGVQYEPVTMVVSVAALAGLAAPYGQVTIYDGATPLAILTLTTANGMVTSATYTTSALAAGTHSLVAKYSPGPCAAVICALFDFTPSQSLPVSLLIQPQDFTISANPPSITIQTEHHASMQLTLAAINQFNGPIYLSCAGAVPKWVTCEFPNSPVILTVPGGAQPTGGTTGPAPQATATFTIDTDALLDYKSETRGVSSRVVLAGLLPVMLLGFARRRKLRGLVIVAMVSVMAMAMTACSGQYPAHTVPGTYTVTVQASGQVVGAPAPTVHTLDVTLVVTP